MPIKIREERVGGMHHRLYCEDDSCFSRSDGKTAVIFAQIELLDAIDGRINQLKRNLKEMDMEKITARRRQTARTKLFGRIGEAEKLRKAIAKMATYRKGKGYWRE